MIVFKLINYKTLSVVMNKLILSLGAQSIELRVNQCKSPFQLSKLIQTVFQIKEEILGVTDVGGKFYDLEYTWQNIATFNNHKLSLITGRESGDNVSFGSRKSNRNQFPHTSKRQRCLGKINDVQTFRKFLPKGISIILTLLQTDSIANIPFEYYRATGSPRWLELWNDSTLILNCQICQNYQLFFSGVVTYLNKFITSNCPNPFPDPEEIMTNEAKKTMIVEAFEQLYEEGALPQLQFYKKKTLLLEKPHYFVNRFFTGQTIDRSELIERIRQDFIKQKEEVKVLEMISNSPNKRHLFTRKDSNNLIQKISSEQQVTLEQEQALNLLLELQHKGLITESQMQIYQSQGLSDNPFLLQLVRLYYEEEFDQSELTRRLKKTFFKRKQEKKLIQ